MRPSANSNPCKTTRVGDVCQAQFHIRQEVIIPTSPENSIRKGRYQVARSGSYAIVPSWKQQDFSGIHPTGLRCSFYVQPWLPDAGHFQTLVSTLDVTGAAGFAIVLTEKGTISVLSGTGNQVETVGTDICLRRWRWAFVDVVIRNLEVCISVKHVIRLAEKAPQPSVFNAKLQVPIEVAGSTALTFAAGYFDSSLQGTAIPFGHFNGRLDSPKIEVFDEATSNLWASYDFSREIPSDNIIDSSPNKRDGMLINAPTRGVKGYNWDGSEPDWTKAKYGYGAIHFHEDDLDDADWDTDFSIAIPENIPSGAYAVVVKDTHGDLHDDITFFVRPPTKVSPESPNPKVAMVLSTFTYLAYANEHMYEEERASHMELAGGVKVFESEHFRNMVRRPDLGLGMYDVHLDGSGTVFSSSKRPILNIRPGYVNWAFHRPREFSADLFMIGFLEERLGRGNYDIVTDHDLHLRGIEAIDRYNVIITGCHPEYPSLESLNAYSSFALAGGNIMYLGGNGFYWCSATDPARPHRMEVRRGDQGCRSFSLAAGERVHSLTGEQGGLWRSRGRTPQTLFGIGSCACGSGPGVPYRVNEDIAKTSELSWLWNGLFREGESLLIGTEGFGGGASGDEIDRLDFELGSPTNTILLASSTGHDDSFGLFNEEQMFPMVDTLGTKCDRVRSDMTYYETSGGGAVFSVGSINWYCSLGWNAYQNNVAALTGNVLKKFLKRERGKDDVVG
ncbi:putative branched-chain amino acid [Phaeomoniella chlamydospora]|uniref:Putative branched-chain amino acid n=1 Tax=Phaeomoniella chlamydospora TaxID=158046 RepID=A0A0G2ESX4_PHACM|nr:putative branched-chain amino acid [Phaeomoniella chlamydospora]